MLPAPERNHLIVPKNKEGNAVAEKSRTHILLDLKAACCYNSYMQQVTYGGIT